MKRTCLWVLVWAMVLAISAPAWAAGLSVGAASADITPEPDDKLPSSGYGQRGRNPMKSVHDRLYCDTLVAGDGENIIAIATCDMVMVSPDFYKKIVAGLAADGFTNQNVLVTASHTHSGPGGMMNNLISNIAFGHYNEKYTQRAADAVVGTIKKSKAGMRPATLRLAETKLEDVTRNRRDPAGSYDYDTRRFKDTYDPNNPKNDIDPTLTLLRFDGPDGQPAAILYHFATHGTVMGSTNWEFSADWIGAARKKISAAYPGAVVLYFNGAQGDQAPTMLYDQHTDWEYVDLIGGRIADGVLGVMEAAQPINAAPIRSVAISRPMEPTGTVMGYKLGKRLLRKWFPVMPLMGVRIGEVGLMCCPVEIVSEVGRTMKDGARGQGVKYPLVVGLANDHRLYTASPDDFTEGGYEVDSTVYGITEAAILIGEQELLMRKLFAE